MKKCLCLLLAGLMLLTACGSDPGKETEPSDRKTSTEAASTQAAAPESTGAQSSAAETAATEGALTELYFVYKGIEMKVGEPAEAVVVALGEPLGYAEFDGCAGLGLEKLYKYADFELGTYQDEERGKGDFIHTILFTSDNAETREGASLGMSREAALKLYETLITGEPAAEQLLLSLGNCDLFMTFRGGLVDSLEYLANDLLD